MPVPEDGNRMTVPAVEPNTILASCNSGFTSSGKLGER
jgi:hypothetical protein